ncbi:MAG: hypothetical protein NT164_03215 [Verrucomicrobiae bacterium]|nr:hypothetical protein [Verrucomicrobiae bacterium]
MPLSVEHFKQAAAQYPDAEALINLPENKGITSAKAPRMGLLSIFGAGSHFDELEKSRAIVSDFKTALTEKYGEEITDFVFPSTAEEEAAISSLKSRTVTTVLKQAELLDLLKQAIVDTITDEQEKPEAADSPFRNVPGEGQRIFSKETIESIKASYYDCVEAAFKVMFRQTTDLHSPQSASKAQEAVKNDLQRAGLEAFSPFISEYFPVKAMRAAMRNNAEVSNIILAPLKPPVPARASYRSAPQPPSSIAAASITTSSESSNPTAEAIPVSLVQSAVRIHDPEWNI